MLDSNLPLIVKNCLQPTTKLIIMMYAKQVPKMRFQAI